MIYILPYLSVFFEVQIFNALSVLDIGIIILTVVAIHHGHKVTLLNQNSIFLIFLLWISICALMLNENSYFQTSSFINNILRALVYFIGMLVIPPYFAVHKRILIFLQQIIYLVLFISMIGIIEFIIKKVNPGFDLRLSTLLGTHYNDPNISRIKTFFSEPAHFNIYLAICTSMLLFAKQNKIAASLKYLNVTIYLGFIATLLSFSLVGIAFLTLNVIWYCQLKYDSHKYLFFSVPVVILLLYIVVINIPTLKTAIFDRIGSVFLENDGSGNQRIFGQIEIAQILPQKNLFIGVGWGQLNHYILKTNQYFEYYWNNGETTGINNSYVSVYMQTGIIGLILYLSYFIISMRKSVFLIFTLVILFFSWGFAMSPIMWMYLYVNKSISINTKTQKIVTIY